ncbi:MAG TPA: DNA mismatch repair endonuclease MutL [Dehalococcoidales bacterium]|nr:DNA mismatch repair endonuclease MutL [Dehalococcoidales bacterium]
MVIKVLEARVISQIAAGEVVERPASVVKELVENALDAGSSQLTIEIKSGGISLIRVTDNGSGIPDSQTETAFQRHATSKISTLVDLENLNSLGFRGEALPSIAAVARVEMLTGVAGEMTGSYLELEDGRLLRHEKMPRSPGTTISVHHLFRSFPARRKFLKSETTESGRIADIVSQYALAYPEVRFTFINESRTALRTPGSGRLLDAVGAVYGMEAAGQMLAIADPLQTGAQPPDDIIIRGLVGTPQLVRATRDYLHFFVNRRWVNNRMLGFALEEAYHGLLMQGKHPVAVINLQIPAGQIDVNVHPAKTEIKFQNERAVFSALQRSVRSVLVQSSPVYQIQPRGADFRVAPSPEVPVQETAMFNSRLPRTAGSPAAPEPSATPLMSLPLLRLLGQLACEFIVAEGPDGLYLIDQHAAHERIMLDKLQRQRTAGGLEKQGLLPSSTLEIEPRLAATLQNYLESARETGFDIEPFGQNAFLVRSIPAVLSGRDWQAALRESLDGQGSWSELLLNRVACHSAVRAGQVLNPEEMRDMLRQLEKTELPNSCPHGRPTMVQITRSQIEKEFGRRS